MKPYKTPWEYKKIPVSVDCTESFRGYDHKHNPPLQYTRHEIVSSGGKIIVLSDLFTSSPENARVEANYSLIVQAVNRFRKELEKY